MAFQMASNRTQKNKLNNQNKSGNFRFIKNYLIALIAHVGVFYN